jgi:hypothetical protein
MMHALHGQLLGGMRCVMQGNAYSTTGTRQLTGVVQCVQQLNGSQGGAGAGWGEILSCSVCELSDADRHATPFMTLLPLLVSRSEGYECCSSSDGVPLLHVDAITY